jgi:hypothetical protein
MQRIRWPRDLSPFSGSDSDSDGQVAPGRTRAGAALKITIPNDSTNGASSSQTVMGVYLFCAGDQVDLSVLKTPPVGSKPARKPQLGTATVTPSDAIFKASPLPISQLIGIPLLMRRLLAKPMPTSPHFDNPLASQLQFDPANSASDHPSSTRGLGTVLVVRADREPLHKDLIDRICAFHANLLNMAQQRGSGSMSEVLKTYATPQRFLDFCMESYQAPGLPPANIANSVHELLGGSWLDLQRPMATA